MTLRLRANTVTQGSMSWLLQVVLLLIFLEAQLYFLNVIAGQLTGILKPGILLRLQCSKLRA